MESVREIVRDGVYATGGQLYVELGGQILCDESFGVYDARTLSSAFCSTKPLLPVALAHLVDRDGLDLDERVTSVTREAPWIPRHATIGDLLTHRAGLDGPTAALWRMRPRDRRPDLLVATEVAEPAYSEVSAWLALAAVVSEVGGASARDFVQAQILDAAGLQRDIVVSPALARAAARDGRVGVPMAGLPDEAVPLLSETLPQQLGEAAPSFGGLVTASGLGRLYAALGRTLRGVPVDGMPSQRALATLLAERRDRAWDRTLRRECAFAGGFMVGLEDHGVVDGLPTAIGHTSGVVTTFGLCDPAKELAVGCCLDGVAMHADDLAYVRRRIMRDVLRMTGIGPC